MTISKGQLIAPVGQTASHRVHQSHSWVGIKVITLLTRTSEFIWQTVVQSPQPLQRSCLITGNSINLFPFYIIPLKANGYM
jgi:hypothetical protein